MKHIVILSDNIVDAIYIQDGFKNHKTEIKSKKRIEINKNNRRELKTVYLTVIGEKL